MPIFKSASKTLKIIALIAIVAPVYFAIDQSWRQGKNEERQKVLSYARDVLARTEATSDQMTYGLKLLTEAKLADPCSKQAISIMRNIDLRSSYIQAVSHITNNVIDYSSLGAHDSVWDIGPVDWVSTRGNSLRNNVQISFAPDTTFIVLEKNGFAFILNKSLLIDATTSEKDVSLASFAQDNQRLFASRGKFNTEWLKDLGDQPEKTFVKYGYVIGVAKSQKYRTTGLAALPTSYMNMLVSHS